MKTKGNILTSEERDILLAAINKDGKFLTINGIGRRLGLPASKVNTIVHQVCIKLGAQDRNEAILLALKWGEINFNDFWSDDELVKLFNLGSSEMLRRMADISHKQLPLLGEKEQTIITDRSQNGLLVNEVRAGKTLLKTKISILNNQERDLLIMTALHPDGKFLTNEEIGQRLGMSGNRVNSLIHQACVKLGVHSRNRAVDIALKKREIILTDIWSLDELAELFCTLGPDMLKRIANIVRRGPKHKHLMKEARRTSIIGRRKDGLLTNRERDVISLVGIGLVNREIADSLHISTGSVRIFLNRACIKLEVSKRSEAFLLALKKREISVGDVLDLNEIVQYLAPLGAESVERMAQLLEQKSR